MSFKPLENDPELEKSSKVDSFYNEEEEDSIQDTNKKGGSSFESLEISKKGSERIRVPIEGESFFNVYKYFLILIGVLEIANLAKTYYGTLYLQSYSKLFLYTTLVNSGWDLFQLVLLYQAIAYKDIGKSEQAIKAIKFFMCVLPIFTAVLYYAEPMAREIIKSKSTVAVIANWGMGLVLIEGILYVGFLHVAKRLRDSLKAKSSSNL